MSCGGGETQLGPAGTSADARSSGRIAEITGIPEMIWRRPIEQQHCALCAGLFPPTERVWWSRPASLMACSSPPASALRPPRGLGGGGAILRRRDREEFWQVQAQARANRISRRAALLDFFETVAGGISGKTPDNRGPVASCAGTQVPRHATASGFQARQQPSG